MRKYKFLLAILVLLLAFDIHAANKTYTSNVGAGGTGNWSNAAAWTPSGVPGTGDYAIIATNQTIVLDVDLLNGPQSGIKRVTVNAGGNLIGTPACTTCGILFSARDSLFVYGTVNIPCIALKNQSGSIVSSTGSLTLYGTCSQIDAGCGLVVSGYSLISGSIACNGTITGTGTFSVATGATVTGTGTAFGVNVTTITPGQTISSFTWKSNAVDNSWSNVNNWSGGAVPTSTSFVSILAQASGSNYPNISASASIKGMVINSGAVVNVSSPAILTMSDSLVIKSGGTLNINENAGITNTGPTKLLGTNCLVIKSSATGTGSFIDNGTIVGSGTMKIQRYSSTAKWHLISSPITNGLSGVYLAQYLKPFYENADAWGAYITPPNIPLVKGKGYAMWPVTTNTFEFSGIPNTGNISAPVTYTPGSAMPGNNLIGNPYPSAIDWNLMPVSNFTNVDYDWILMWNPINGNYGLYQKSTGSSTGGVTRYIPLGQGFFVKAVGAAPVVTIPNVARVHSNQAFLKETENQVNHLKLTFTGGTGADDVLINFMSSASSSYVETEDMEKWYGDHTAPQAYSYLASETMKLMVNSVPDLSSDMVVPVYLETGVNGSYSVAAEGLETLPSNYHYYLEDIKEGYITDLSKTDYYAFESDTNDVKYRFNLHLLKNALGVSDIQDEKPFLLYSSGEKAVIRLISPEILPADIFVYDISGRLIAKKENVRSEVVTFNLNSATGTYIFRVTTASGSYTGKLFIE